MAWIFVLLLPFADVLCLLLTLPFVSAKVEEGDRVILRGDTLSVPVRLRNDGLLPVGCVEVVLSVPEGKGRRARTAVRRLMLPPFSEGSAEVGGTFDHRGHFTVGVEELFLYDYLRLIRLRKRARRRVTVQVLPRRLSSAEALPPLDHSGSRRPAPMEQGIVTEYGDIREFRPGDGMKSIHWKLSTKLDELQVRKYTSETDKELLVFAELTMAESPWPLADGASLSAEDRVAEETLSAVCDGAEGGAVGRVQWFERGGEPTVFSFSDPTTAERIAFPLSEAEGGSGRFSLGEASGYDVSVLCVAAYSSPKVEETIRRVVADAVGSPVAALLISLEDLRPVDAREAYRTELADLVRRLSESGVTVTVPVREEVASG
jgi:hypothetical protein